jgi:hypothetical protein
MLWAYIYATCAGGGDHVHSHGKSHNEGRHIGLDEQQIWYTHTDVL